jgi:heme-degrading monooxygenase HmoA
MVTILIEFPVDDLEHAIHVMHDNARILEEVTRDARSRGAARSHRFYTTDDNRLIAVDVWDSERTFHDFFDSNEQIQDLVKQAGIQGMPKVTVLTEAEIAGTF